MAEIAGVWAREVLDSRGRPTVEAEIELDDGTRARASVPAGASTGRHEARELRDGEPARYGGRGVRRAATAIKSEIGPALLGRDPQDQAAIDRTLIDLDGTSTKERLGANSILAVSLATARVAAASARIPLWRHLGGASDGPLPSPMVNIVSGGLHARRSLDFQDFLIIPRSAESFAHAVEMAVAVRDAAGSTLAERGLCTLKADEGGFGPLLESNASALELLMDAVAQAGLTPGDDIAFAIDVAATHFYSPNRGIYALARDGDELDADGLIGFLTGLVDAFPIVALEDPLAEDDWPGWQQATRRLGERVLLIGDDLFVTNPARLRRGIDARVANSVLVKMNQIGTITETLEVVSLAREVGYKVIVSARSGETEDSALADLAFACQADYVKIGSVAQSERLAKYNQLLRIEESLRLEK